MSNVLELLPSSMHAPLCILEKTMTVMMQTATGVTLVCDRICAKFKIITLKVITHLLLKLNEIILKDSQSIEIHYVMLKM